MKGKILFILLIAFLTISTTSATIYYVKPDGTGNGSSWTQATDLQTALSKTDVTEIRIAEGTYYPTDGIDRNASFVIKKNVSIYGGFQTADLDDDKTNLSDYTRDRTSTILSGEIQQDDDPTNNAYHVVVLKGGNTIDGFTITGGYADDSDTNTIQKNRGAGIYARVSDHVTISNNLITNNTNTSDEASFGGGIYTYNNEAKTLTLADNTIRGNAVISGTTAGGGGGGVYAVNYEVGNLILVNNIIQENSSSNSNNSLLGKSSSGGGVYVRNENSGTVDLINNTIQGNTSSTHTSAYGGGVWARNEDSGIITLTRNTIQGNSTFSPISSSYGGGAYAGNEASGSVILTNNLIRENTSSVGNGSFTNGGGVYASINGKGSFVLANNTIVKNKLEGKGNKQGSGIFTNRRLNKGPDIQLYNTILWGNTGGGAQIKTRYSAPIVSHCLIEGGYAEGTDMITGDPQFVDYDNNDFRLKATSPAINTGSNDRYNDVGTLATDKDLAGNDRLFDDGIIDIGAYELHLSSDAALSNLTVSEGTLTPVFSVATTNYAVSVPYSISSLVLTATTNQLGANVTGDGDKTLTVGTNTFSIVVTAEDRETSNTYTVTVTRGAKPIPPTPPAKNSDATLKSLTVSTGMLSPAFASHINSYTVELYGINSLQVEGIVNNYMATVSGNGVYNLEKGKNTITLIVTAEDGTTNTYTLEAIRTNVEVGIREVASGNTKVYPTLTTGKVYIQSMNGIPTIELYSITGKLLRKTQAFEIDLSNYSKGIYILRTEGKAIKVVKQ